MSHRHSLCLLVVVWSVELGLAQTPNFYAARTQALAVHSFQVWQTVSAAQRHDLAYAALRPATPMDAKARVAARQQAVAEYFSRIVPVMQPSPEIAHLSREHPVDLGSDASDQMWLSYYSQAKSGLRPKMTYRWTTNATRDSAVITLSDEHVATLQANYDYLIWYRNQLEQLATCERHAGARHFRRFLDCLVADIIEGLPTAPRFRLETGSVDVPDWKLDERNLREQVVMVYRYLMAKYLVYPQYEQFAPADRELLLSLMKVSCLLGCRLDDAWFGSMKIPMDQATTSTRWKKPLAAALRVLQAKAEEQAMSDGEKLASPARLEEACIITIPPPAPKQPAPAAPQEPAPDTRIEIIVRPK